MVDSNKITDRTIAISAFVSAVVAVVLVLFFGFQTKHGAPPNRGQNLYSEIRAAGTIRAAYAVGAPLFVIDPKTNEKSGIFFEVVNRAAEKLNLNVRWSEEVGYGEMIEGLNAGRYDLIGSGVWINGARGKDADFTIPLYYDAVLPYVRNDDTRFDKEISILNAPDFKISTMDGEMGATIAKTDFPKARTESIPQNSDFTLLTLNVINKKADVVFLSVGHARLFQLANPGKIRAVNPAKPIRLFGNALMIPKGAYDLQQSLDYAFLEMLNNGEIDPILNKYEAAPGSFYRRALPYSQPGPAQ
jgi:polar amino acid transport system substrate-binding protein